MTSDTLMTGLSTLKRRLLGIGLSSGFAWGILLALGVMLGCMWLDLALELSPQMRMASFGLAFFAGLVLLARVLVRLMRRAQAGALARRLDETAGTRGQILSGIDLMTERARFAGMSGSLADLAMHRAAAAVSRVDPAQAVPSKPMRLAFGVLAGSLFVLMMVSLGAPRLAATQWNRFLDPYGDHPPYSPTIFVVTPGNETVRYGDPLPVEVETRGQVVDDIDLIIESPAGQERETLPMFPGQRGVWRATLAHVTEPARYYVKARRARSERYELGVITVPRLEKARFRITPPAYTHQPAYEGLLPQGGLAGLPGTRVEVWLTSNRPLSGGALDLATEAGTVSLEMKPVGDRAKEVTAQFEIHEPGRMAMKVIDVAGQPSSDTFSAPIVILEDERPFVRLLEPKQVSLATPDVSLPVAISAEDDYGVSRLELYRSLNDSRALPMEVAIPSPSPRRFQEMLRLPMASYGLEPGDTIKLYARVEDSDPNGPKGSESPIAVVRIISTEDYMRMVRVQQGIETMQSKYAEAQRRLENMIDEMEKLAEELAKQPPDSELSKEMQQRLDELAAQMQREAQEIRKTADIDLPYDLDKQLTPELDRLAEMMERAAKDLEKANSEKSEGGKIPKAGGMSDKLKEMAKACQGGEKEFKEEASEPIEHLAKIYPLLEDEARFLAVYQQQKSLAERLASLKGRDKEDNPKLKSRMRDLEAEQRQNREKLRELVDDINDHVKQLPDDKRLDDLRQTASEFAKGVAACGASESMSKAESSLGAFEGTPAHANAQEAADTLEKFISQCSGMGKGGRACLTFQPKLSSCMGQTVEQLLADAGLAQQMGNGMGTGAGGGYSANRSTLQNVGLYGGMPRMSDMTRSGRGERSMLGGAPYGHGAGGDPTDPLTVDPTGELEAAGAADAVVPLDYRARVGAYFERIADELGEQR